MSEQSELRKRMEALVTGEAAEEATDEGPVPLANYKPLMQQLVLAMQAMGMDHSDDEQVEVFLKMLKGVATTKSSMFKQALRQWSSGKATKAVKTAKSSL